jgi:hypothetical protein
MKYDYHKWKPITPAKAKEIMNGLPVPWWIAGGWAVDLFVGRQSRQHEDLDILVLRSNQLCVQRHLSNWELHAADPPGELRPWKDGEFLETGIHDIWCRLNPSDAWQFQIMLAEDMESEWIFRRNPAVRGEISKLGMLSSEGIPYLAPEVQLLYKARAKREPKDEADFLTALPRMNISQRKWLCSALLQTYPEGHPWIGRLSELSEPE